MTYQATIRADTLWDDEKIGVTVSGRPILMVRLNGHISAFADRCAHKGAALSAGRLDGCRLTCPLHEWTYDAETGQGVNPACIELERYPLKIEEGVVWVDVAPR